jgi:predicted nucleotidyltransferase
MTNIPPTPYSDVNEILNLLLSNVKEILSNQFVGMYLYGSLASGDFNPQTSDIDFIVVTSEPLSKSLIDELEAMHQRIWASGLKWAPKLEGSYIPIKDIRRHDSNNAPCPIINEGEFYVARHGSDWIIQRHVVRECGALLEGPDPREIIEPVSPNDLRSAALGVLHEWWFPMLDQPDWLQNHGPNYHGYAVITMCRALHALKHGAIVSKPAAIQWARDELGAKWQLLIDQAVASQYGRDSNFLDETLELIRFTREQTLIHKSENI